MEMPTINRYLDFTLESRKEVLHIIIWKSSLGTVVFSIVIFDIIIIMVIKSVLKF